MLSGLLCLTLITSCNRKDGKTTSNSGSGAFTKAGEATSTVSPSQQATPEPESPNLSVTPAYPIITDTPVLEPTYVYESGPLPGDSNYTPQPNGLKVVAPTTKISAFQNDLIYLVFGAFTLILSFLRKPARFAMVLIFVIFNSLLTIAYLANNGTGFPVIVMFALNVGALMRLKEIKSL